MTYDEFIEIFDDEEISGSLLSGLDGDNAMIGLNLIAKYIKGRVLQSAEHDVIYSATVEELVEAGITKDDAEYLSRINWAIEDGSLICFV